MRRIAGWLLLVGSICALVFANPGMAPAEAASAVSVSLTPATVSLEAGKSVQVVVVVENASGSLLSEIRVDPESNAGVIVSAPTRALSSIPQGGIDTTVVTITGDAAKPIAGSVEFVLSALTTTEDGTAIPVSVVTTLTVLEKAPLPADQVISATVVTALSKLSDRASPRLFVQVENTSNVDVSVMQIRGVVPPFLSVCLNSGCPPDPNSVITVTDRNDDGTPKPLVVLAPHEQELFGFVVAKLASLPFQSGKHVMLFRVEATRVVSGIQRTASVIAKHEFETVVFGEAEILSPLGLTSFLVLPGFLLIVVWGGLWQYAWPKNALAFLGATKPEFWILVITGSLAAIPVYRLFSGRSLLDGYDSSDLFAVWTGAVIAGLLLWFASLGMRWAVRRSQSRRRTFFGGETPRGVLVKLARAHDSLSRKLVSVRLSNDERENGLLLAKGPPPMEKTIVTPSIDYTFKRDASELAKSDFQVAVQSDYWPYIRKAIGFWPRALWPFSQPLVSLKFRRGKLIGVSEYPEQRVSDLNQDSSILTPVSPDTGV